MLVRHIMTDNVVTIPSNTPVLDARRIMEAHRIGRLPVLDKAKLVGLVTKDKLASASPSVATSLSIYELNYLLAKMSVRDIMEKNVVTVSPDATVEAAVALAQERRVGSLPVMEKDKLVGIVTTNDFFYKILNPLLGIGQVGTRLTVYNCPETSQMMKVLAALDKHKAKIINLHYLPSPEGETKDFTIHIDTTEATTIVNELNYAGFTAKVRER